MTFELELISTRNFIHAYKIFGNFRWYREMGSLLPCFLDNLNLFKQTKILRFTTRELNFFKDIKRKENVKKFTFSCFFIALLIAFKAKPDELDVR